MHLITGATGNIGRGVVELLHEQSHDVRALVRDPSRAELLPAGIDIAVGDLDDADSVKAALRGVDSVFLLHVGPGTTQTQIMIDAARDVGVDRIVLLSSIGARLRPVPMIGSILAAREDLLRASGLDVTYLRPNGLMSNALGWATGSERTTALSTRRTPAASPSSIPTTSPASPRSYSPKTDTSATATSSTGPKPSPPANKSKPSPTSSDTASSSSPSPPSGTPAQLAGALQNLNELFRAGRAGVIADDIENLTGIAPRTFRDWCERHINEFRPDTTHNTQIASPTA
jgi:hypothetical protein